MNVHVPQKRIVPDSCPYLPTNSGQHPFGWSGPFAQPPCSWTSGKVAASRIEEIVTPSASGLSDWQRESQALQQEHAEQMGRNSVLELLACGTTRRLRCGQNESASGPGVRLDGQSTSRSSCGGCQ